MKFSLFPFVFWYVTRLALGTIMNVRGPVITDRISQTSFMDLPRISTPFTSNTSSPSWSSPLFSAAPPLTIRPIITASPSFRTVAPCTHKFYKFLFE